MTPNYPVYVTNINYYQGTGLFPDRYKITFSNPYRKDSLELTIHREDLEYELGQPYDLNIEIAVAELIATLD